MERDQKAGGRDQGLMALDGKELILGVTGSIAAYKAVYTFCAS